MKSFKEYLEEGRSVNESRSVGSSQVKTSIKGFVDKMDSMIQTIKSFESGVVSIGDRKEKFSKKVRQLEKSQKSMMKLLDDIKKDLI